MSISRQLYEYWLALAEGKGIWKHNIGIFASR